MAFSHRAHSDECFFHVPFPALIPVSLLETWKKTLKKTWEKKKHEKVMQLIPDTKKKRPSFRL
jgi:hypothetical protein